MKIRELIIAKKYTFLIIGLCIGAFIGSQSLMGQPPESVGTALNTINSVLMYVGVIFLVLYWSGHILAAKGDWK